ncbi:hypothetical protein FOZ63_006490, partial [Perkinsus olseni]
MPRLRKAGFANTLHPPASADHGSGREGHDRPAIVVTPSPAFHPRHVPDVPRSRRESSLEEPSPKRQRLTSVDEDELYDSSIPLLPPATLVAGDSSTNHWDEPDYDDDEFEMEDTLANRVLLSVMGSRAFRSSMPPHGSSSSSSSGRHLGMLDVALVPTTGSGSGIFVIDVHTGAIVRQMK